MIIVDKKSQKLIFTFFVLMIISIFATYYRTVITKNYPTIEPASEEQSVQ
jgi:hypothetical protein